MRVCLAIAVCLFLVSCGGNNSATNASSTTPTSPANNPSISTVSVSYAAFSGRQFTATAPTLCPKSPCAFAPLPPTVVVNQPGTLSYQLNIGSTYGIVGSLEGNLNGVTSDLLWQIFTDPSQAGAVPHTSFQVTDLAGIQPSGYTLNISSNTCSAAFHFFNASSTLNWLTIFTVLDRSSASGQLC